MTSSFARRLRLHRTAEQSYWTSCRTDIIAFEFINRMKVLLSSRFWLSQNVGAMSLGYAIQLNQIEICGEKGRLINFSDFGRSSWPIQIGMFVLFLFFIFYFSLSIRLKFDLIAATEWTDRPFNECIQTSKRNAIQTKTIHNPQFQFEGEKECFLNDWMLNWWPFNSSHSLMMLTVVLAGSREPSEWKMLIMISFHRLGCGHWMNPLLRMHPIRVWFRVVLGKVSESKSKPGDADDQTSESEDTTISLSAADLKWLQWNRFNEWGTIERDKRRNKHNSTGRLDAAHKMRAIVLCWSIGCRANCTKNRPIKFPVCKWQQINTTNSWAR